MQTYIDPNDKTCSTRDVQSTFRKEQTFAANTMEEFASANRLSPPLLVTACVEELTVNTAIWFLSLSPWITLLNIDIRLIPNKVYFKNMFRWAIFFSGENGHVAASPTSAGRPANCKKPSLKRSETSGSSPNKRSLLKTAFTDSPGFDLEKSWEDLGWYAKMFETTSQGHVYLVLTFFLAHSSQ